jgi:hypothetical protein
MLLEVLWKIRCVEIIPTISGSLYFFVFVWKNFLKKESKIVVELKKFFRLSLNMRMKNFLKKEAKIVVETA